MPSWDISRPRARMLWNVDPARPVCFPARAADPRRPTIPDKAIIACARCARRFSRALRSCSEKTTTQEIPVVIQFQNIVLIRSSVRRRPTKT